jgi:hypothetical protein
MMAGAEQYVRVISYTCSGMWTYIENLGPHTGDNDCYRPEDAPLWRVDPALTWSINYRTKEII